MRRQDLRFQIQEKFNFIPEGVANKCFGFTGSESNFLRSWMNVQFYHGSRKEVETYGYLWQVELSRIKQKAFVECNGEKELQTRS